MSPISPKQARRTPWDNWTTSNALHQSNETPFICTLTHTHSGRRTEIYVNYHVSDFISLRQVHPTWYFLSGLHREKKSAPTSFPDQSWPEVSRAKVTPSYCTFRPRYTVKIRKKDYWKNNACMFQKSNSLNFKWKYNDMYFYLFFSFNNSLNVGA